MSRSAYSARLAEECKSQLVREAAESGRRWVRRICERHKGTVHLLRSSCRFVLEQTFGSLPMDQIFASMDGFRDLLWVSTDTTYIMAGLFKVERLSCEVCGGDVPVYTGGPAGRPSTPMRSAVRRSYLVLCGLECTHALGALAALNGWAHVPFSQSPGSLGLYAYSVGDELRVVPQASRLAWNETNWREAPKASDPC